MPSRSIRDDVEEIEDPDLRAKAKKLLRQSPRYHRGLVASTDSEGNVGWIPWQHATAQGPTGTKQNKLTSRSFGGSVLNNDPIKKRSDRERVESLARRFWDVVKDNPNMAPLVLKELHAEYWKHGQPVSYEDMRLAAIELLKKAAEDAAKAKKTG